MNECLFSRMTMRRARIWLGVITLGLCAAANVRAETFYDRHVIFDNSFADRSYYRSEGMAVAPSKLELVDGKFPVDSNHFKSPPNSLRLKWKSAPGGDWRMKLLAPKQYGRKFEFEGDTMSFWCFSETGLTPEESPRISLQSTNQIGTSAIPLLGEYGCLPAREWVRISIPFERFRSLFQRTDDLKFDPSALAAIWLIQGLDDGKEHTLYLDDAQIYDRDRAASPPPGAPTGLTARGYERHFDLTWTRNPERGLLRYQIYRSWGYYIEFGQMCVQ